MIAKSLYIYDDSIYIYWQQTIEILPDQSSSHNHNTKCLHLLIPGNLFAPHNGCSCDMPRLQRDIDNYIPQIWKCRGYYVFGCAAAVSAVSAISAARQRLYRPSLPCHKYTNQIHIRHSHWGPRLQEPYDFWASIGKTKWPLVAILHRHVPKVCGVSNCVINSLINFIFCIAIDNT